VSDLLIDGRPDDCRSLCYVAFKTDYPALAAASGAERHISTGATLGIRLSDWLHFAAIGGAPMCIRRNWSTPSFSKTT
jgi:hypothetical protein